MDMDTLSFKGKSYPIDGQGFLSEPGDWDEGFAEAMAPASGIPGGLTPTHWDVIRHIRTAFADTGDCPLVFATCRATRLSLNDFKALFPTGYLRGACRLAGITYRDRFVNYFGEEPADAAAPGNLHAAVGSPGPGAAAASSTVAATVASTPRHATRIYRVDVLGFLDDPEEWDEAWAVGKVHELTGRTELTEAHWQVLHWLRRHFHESGSVPTVIECCEGNGLELEDLAALFPGGYQRQAVKLAGLCVRPG
jgi:TusE/DsrC/DsvC family sulfur relay protein